MTSGYRHHMRHALNLAARGLGRTAPNPAVGALVIQNDQVIARGWTAPGGRPHAEPIALERAGKNARGATMVVTLEPCSHHGKTPPCTEAIIRAGIKRLVVACEDPNPKVNGRGIAQLREAGIEVMVGECREEAEALNVGFFSALIQQRPYAMVKIATSSDNKITHPKQRWITGELARNYAHMLRARHDAILTGIGTVLADDPALTCRLPGMREYSPIRIVLDASLKIPLNSQLVRTAHEVPLWVVTSAHADAAKQSTLEKLGVRLLRVNAADSRVELKELLTVLAERSNGITRLMVEGGAKLTHAMLASGLANGLCWFRAPIAAGEGLTFQPPSLPAALEKIALGEDILEIYKLNSEL